MRLKDPFSLKTTDMTKRTNKPKKPRDEESSDEVSGLTCQHVSKAVELNSVKKAVTGSLWSVCSDCMKERDVMDMQQAGTHDIRVCLKCGFQGCSQSESQHSVKHQQAHHSDSHCISISLSTWKAWCFECNEELSTHCNKKALAQTVDFLQKHSAKSASDIWALSRMAMWLQTGFQMFLYWRSRCFWLHVGSATLQLIVLKPDYLPYIHAIWTASPYGPSRAFCVYRWKEHTLYTSVDWH